MTLTCIRLMEFDDYLLRGEDGQPHGRGLTLEAWCEGCTALTDKHMLSNTTDSHL
jgi:hypothetical protein